MYQGNYFSIDNFAGGYAGNLRSTKLKLTQAYDLDNIVVLPDGNGFRSRLGNSKFNASVMNTGANVQGIGYYIQEDLDEWLVAVCGDKIYKSDSLDGTMDDITGGLTVTAGADNQWDLVTFNDVLFGFGGPKAGPDAAFKFTGTGNAVVLTGNPSTPLAGAFAANNRMFGWAGSTMYWTVIGDAEDWSGSGSGSAVIGSLKDNESITGVKIISTNYVLVFKENSVHQMVISSAPFPTYSMFPTTGASGKSASVNIDGTVYFIAQNKHMYSTNGETIKEYSKLANNLWNSTQDARLPYVVGFRQEGDDYDWIVWLISTTGSTNNKAIIWDLNNNCWLQCTSGYKMNVAIPDSVGNVYLGGYDGFIYKPDQATTYADASEAANSGRIDSYWQTGWVSPDQIDKITQVRKLKVVYTPKASGVITVNYGYDGVANGTSFTLAQTVTASETYGDKSSILSGRGNTFECKISQSSTTIDMEIESIELSGKSYGQKDQTED